MNQIQDFKPDIKIFLLVASITVVLSVGGIFLLRGLSPTPAVQPTINNYQPVSIAQQVFISQEECEQKTGKHCFVFRGFCQVMVAQTEAEAEANEKFLRDCEKMIGTWRPTEETLETDTSGWQTYRNDEFGFELKYPTDFQEYGYTKRDDSFSAQSTETRRSLHVNVVTGKASLQEYLDEVDRTRATAYEGDPSVAVLRRYDVGGNLGGVVEYPAIQQVTQLLAAALVEIETFIDGSSEVIIDISVRGGEGEGPEPDESLWQLNNQILATFRFVDKTSPVQGVILSTEKKGYAQGEIVRIAIRNNLKEGILFVPPYGNAIGVPGPIEIQKKLMDGTWKTLSLSFPPPPIAPPTLNDYTKINSDDGLEFTWDQKIFETAGHRFLGGSGMYRAKFLYIPESKAQKLGYPSAEIWPMSEDFTTIYSDQFEVN